MLKVITLISVLAATSAHAALNLASFGALDVKRTGGTANGSIAGQPGSVQIEGKGSYFQLRGSGGWEFHDDGGQTPLHQPDAFDFLDLTALTYTSLLRVDENAITLSADRFNPSDVRHVAARNDDQYFAVEALMWNDGKRDRLRLTGVYEESVSTVPEASSSALMAGAAGLLAVLVVRARRRAARP